MEINEKLAQLLEKEGFEVFLPISINIDAVTSDEMQIVATHCYDEIDKCDIMLIVHPYGKSVSAEIGYAIAERRHKNNPRKLILYNNDVHDMETLKKTQLEVMINPYIDFQTDDLSELIECFNSMTHAL